MHLEKIAFDFVESVSQIHDLDGLNRKVADFLKHIGGDFYLLGQIVFPGGLTRPVTLLGNHQHDWLAFYRNNRLAFEDPAMHHAKHAIRPYTWSWISKTFDLTTGEQFVMNESRNFGLSEGLIVPMFGPKGAIGGLTVAGPHLETGPAVVAATQMTMSAAYHQALHITQLFETVRPSKLTKRQRECLHWAQHGKSNRDIATLLGISAGTVKDHIDAAKKVFGVRSRVEAVMAAHRENLLGF